MIEFLIGIAITILTFLVWGMYLKIIKKLETLEEGLLYLVQREYEIQEEETKALQDLEEAKNKLKTVYKN